MKRITKPYTKADFEWLGEELAAFFIHPHSDSEFARKVVMWEEHSRFWNRHYRQIADRLKVTDLTQLDPQIRGWAERLIEGWGTKPRSARSLEVEHGSES